MGFYIAKIFTAFLLPPGIFVIILIIAGFAAKKWKYLFFVSAFFLYLLSLKPVANVLISPLESFRHYDKISPKAVVVLGGGVNPNGVFKALPDAFKREMYGMLLAKKHDLPMILTGGGKIKEAIEAKKDIQKFEKTCGCKIEYIPESRALNTYQNAKYTSELFKKLHLKKEIFLVTSAYHMKRAYILFKKFGFKIKTKPVDFKAVPVTRWLDFLPDEGSFNISYKAVHEYIGILRAKLR